MGLNVSQWDSGNRALTNQCTKSGASNNHVRLRAPFTQFALSLLLCSALSQFPHRNYPHFCSKPVEPCSGSLSINAHLFVLLGFFCKTASDCVSCVPSCSSVDARDFGGSALKVRERVTVWSFYEAGPEDGDWELSVPQSGIREEE